MRLLADLNIAPRTVEFLQSLGHDVARVGEALPVTASDVDIVNFAVRDARTIVTQDLDFSAIVALSGRSKPSVVSLRVSSARVEAVNARLAQVLATIEREVQSGAIVSVEDDRVRSRMLPVS